MKYFFDVRDGEDFVRDERGVDLPDPTAAKLQATLALTEMARDDLPRDGDSRRLTIHVRTVEGPQFDVSLDYEVQNSGTSVQGPDCHAES
jgi:hypothetical protein